MKNKLSFSIFLFCLVLTAHAQTSERIIATSKGTYDGSTFVSYDSTKITYLGRSFYWDDNLYLNFIQNRIDNNEILYNTQKRYAFDESISYWEQNYRYTVVFDTNENTRIETLENYDEASSSWVNYKKYIKTYNDAGIKTILITQDWDNATSSWINYSKETYIIDANGNVADLIYQSWNTNNWSNFSKMHYTYAFDNKLATKTHQVWNTSFSTWIDKNKSTFIYTGTIINEYYYQYWDSSLSKWENYEKRTFIADASGKIIEKTIQIYDLGTSSWGNVSKHLINYDANGNGKELIRQNWNKNTSSFVNEYMELITYSPGNNITSISKKYWNFGNFWEYTDFSPIYNIFYETYTPTSVGKVVSQNGTVNIYPSPASSTMTIDLQWNELQRFSVQIIDAMGRTVKSWKQPATNAYKETINIEDVANGNY